MEVQKDNGPDQSESALVTAEQISVAEKIQKLREKATKRRKRNRWFIAVAFYFCLVFIWWGLVVNPKRKMMRVGQFMDAGDYETAYQLLNQLTDTEEVMERKLKCIDALIGAGKYEEAFSRLVSLGKYDGVKERQDVCIDSVKACGDYKTAYIWLKLLDDTAGMSKMKTELAISLTIDESNVSAKEWEVCLLEKSIDEGYYRKCWQQQNEVYFLFSESIDLEPVYTIMHYQEGKQRVDQRTLDLGEEKEDKGLYLNMEEGGFYVDEDGSTHAIARSFSCETKYWLCTFNSSGDMERCSPMAAHLNDPSSDAGGVLNFAINFNGNVVYWNERAPWKDHYSGTAFLAEVREGFSEGVSEDDLIFEQTYSGETSDVRITGQGNLLRLEKSEYGEDILYASIWKVDGVTGEKEIVLKNIPASSEVDLVEGSNDDAIFISWNKALWEVKGPNEIKLILRYEDVEALQSGVKDVFRMTDGSWGFVIEEEKKETSISGKYYTIIRVSAK